MSILYLDIIFDNLALISVDHFLQTLILIINTDYFDLSLLQLF